MAHYSINFKVSVAKDLRCIPKAEVKKILTRIDQLAEDPRPVQAEKLTNREEYRVRQGRYRILYTVSDEIVCIEIVKIAHRKDIYR